MRTKLLIIITILLAVSGCLEQQVESGDTVEVNYIGMLENGEVFDTSYASVALNKSIPKSEDFQIRADYSPHSFKAGKGEMIKGFDKAIIGMKRGEIKTFTVSPEEGYGTYDPNLVMSIPRTQYVSRTHVENRIAEVEIANFEAVFSEKAVLNKSLKIPETNINATVVNITLTSVYLEYNLKPGDVFEAEGAPWNETVVSANQTAITLSINPLLNQTIQDTSTPWNSTVIAFNNTTIVLWHNPIPRTMIQTAYGPAIILFRETTIDLDYNHPLAGKSLTFRIEVVNLTRSQK